MRSGSRDLIYGDGDDQRKVVDDALKLSNAAVVEALEGLPPQKLHCSVLAEEAVKAAVEDYRKKKAEKAGEDCTETK